MRPLLSPFAHGKTSIFTVMSKLAVETGAINLGQGFPDDKGDPVLLQKAANALLHDSNQYPPMPGLPVLREAIAAHDKTFYGLDIDPACETLVTTGATDALSSAFLALIDPGDEVVVIAPSYDLYVPMIKRAGGTPRFVTLQPPLWQLDENNLRAAFSVRTKAIVVNNPLNPAARVFSRDELMLIRNLALEFDTLIIADEAYEHIVFDQRPFHSLLTLPDLRQRVVRIGSAGKTFSLTGWKVGWAVGDAALIGAVSRAHQFTVFTTPPNLQTAVAFGLNQPRTTIEALPLELQRRRDRFILGLTDIGIVPLPCEGTYFVCVDALANRLLRPGENDAAFCERLTREVGVCAIPVSAFHEEAPSSSVIRFCFAKQDAVIDAALERLRKAFA